MAALAERTVFSDRETRALAVAVVASVVLHAAILLALPMLREAQQRHAEVREPIVARLVEPPKPAEIAAPAPTTPEVKKPVAAPAPPQPVQRPVKPAPKPVTRAPLAVEPKPDKIDSPPVRQAAPIAEAPPSAPPRSPTNEGTPSASARSSAIQAQPAPAASDAPDAGTLAQYRLAVISAARHYKRYPRLALENNWQGKVEVRLSIGADGRISGLSVRSSTGHSLLDQQALDMIERAKAAAQIPPALRGKQFVVDIPVEFTLRDAGA